MPEGDTIHRIAVQLGPRLIGKVLERVTTQGLTRTVAGATVIAVTAHGKHLVVELDTGAYLLMHLGMYGRQRSYPRNEGDVMLAKISPGRVSLALMTSDGVHLWIGARMIEISDRRAPRHGQAISTLGPDVLADDFDSRQAASRAALHPTRRAGAVPERSPATSSAIRRGGPGRVRTANPRVGPRVSGYRSCSRLLRWSGLPDRTTFNQL